MYLLYAMIAFCHVFKWCPAAVGADCESESEEPALAKKSAPEPIWAKLPWLLDALHPAEVSGRVDTCGKKNPQPEDMEDSSIALGGPETEETSDLDEFDDVLDLLYDRRFHYAAAPAPRNDDFEVVLRGGRWTQQNMGVPYDSLRGFSCMTIHRHL